MHGNFAEFCTAVQIFRKIWLLARQVQYWDNELFPILLFLSSNPTIVEMGEKRTEVNSIDAELCQDFVYNPLVF